MLLKSQTKLGHQLGRVDSETGINTEYINGTAQTEFRPDPKTIYYSPARCTRNQKTTAHLPTRDLLTQKTKKNTKSNN